MSFQNSAAHKKVVSHPAVHSVDDGGRGEYFVNLKKGHHWSGQRSFGVDSPSHALKMLKDVKKGHSEHDVDEEAPAVSAGSGGVAGIGVGPKGEPGVHVKRSKFAGNDVFEVAPEYFQNARMGKNRYHKYSQYVGEDEIGQEIRKYGNENPANPIILKCNRTGAMMYLKYGKRNQIGSSK